MSLKANGKYKELKVLLFVIQTPHKIITLGFHLFLPGKECVHYCEFKAATDVMIYSENMAVKYMNRL